MRYPWNVTNSVDISIKRWRRRYHKSVSSPVQVSSDYGRLQNIYIGQAAMDRTPFWMFILGGHGAMSIIVTFCISILFVRKLFVPPEQVCYFILVTDICLPNEQTGAGATNKETSGRKTLSRRRVH